MEENRIVDDTNLEEVRTLTPEEIREAEVKKLMAEIELYESMYSRKQKRRMIPKGQSFSDRFKSSIIKK